MRLTVSSEVANRYFQGAENVPIASPDGASSRVATCAALELIPMTKPVYARYRALLKADFPHLIV